MTGPTLRDIPRDDSPFNEMTETTEFSTLRSDSAFCVLNGHKYGAGYTNGYGAQTAPRPVFLFCPQCGDVIWITEPDGKDAPE